jgi:hypothetical protein
MLYVFFRCQSDSSFAVARRAQMKFGGPELICGRLNKKALDPSRGKRADDGVIVRSCGLGVSIAPLVNP